MWKLYSHKKKEERPARSPVTMLLTLLVAAALVVVVLVNIFTHVFSVVQYFGDSMEPGLSDRQVLLVLKTDKVARGDVAAFYYNNKVLVRRRIADGGTSLEIDETGTVIVDGERLSEPYVETPSRGQCNISFPYTIPHDEYFMMGDNRIVAMDSRLAEIGTIPSDRVIGKVVFSIG